MAAIAAARIGYFMVASIGSCRGANPRWGRVNALPVPARPTPSVQQPDGISVGVCSVLLRNPPGAGPAVIPDRRLVGTHAKCADVQAGDLAFAAGRQRELARRVGIAAADVGAHQRCRVDAGGGKHGVVAVAAVAGDAPEARDARFHPCDAVQAVVAVDAVAMAERVAAGVDAEQGEQDVQEGRQELHGGPHMLRNRDMKGALTGSVSSRCFRRTVPRPLSSRLMPAIALRLTMVERWICLNVFGSSTASRSLIGVRSSDWPSAVTTVVYLLSARK